MPLSLEEGLNCTVQCIHIQLLWTYHLFDYETMKNLCTSTRTDVSTAKASVTRVARHFNHFLIEHNEPRIKYFFQKLNSIQ